MIYKKDNIIYYIIPPLTIMNPIISQISEDQGHLYFRIAQCNVSIANALRRIILSEIPTIVFRTSPYERNNSTFDINTTRLNNELIKQRLSCIPIHISDTEFPYKNYIIEVDKKNEGDAIDYVTTADFKIKDLITNTYLTPAATKAIFPPNALTGDYIDFVRLRPRISENISGEHLKMSCTLDIGMAKEDNAFNITSTCAYACSLDETKIKQTWLAKEAELKKNGIKKEDIEFAERDWHFLDARRIFIPDSFDFVLQTVGPFDNMAIIFKAAHVMLRKLIDFKNTIQAEPDLIVASEATIANSFDINIPREGYTLGKVIEFVLYNMHYGKTLTYCGFRKPHPHIDLSLIRLGFSDAADKAVVTSYLLGAADEAIKVFTKIASAFDTTMLKK